MDLLGDYRCKDSYEQTHSTIKKIKEIQIKNFYTTYIKNELGNKRIKQIRQMDIKNVIKKIRLLKCDLVTLNRT